MLVPRYSCRFELKEINVEDEVMTNVQDPRSQIDGMPNSSKRIHMASERLSLRARKQDRALKYRQPMTQQYGRAKTRGRLVDRQRSRVLDSC